MLFYSAQPPHSQPDVFARHINATSHPSTTKGDTPSSTNSKEKLSATDSPIFSLRGGVARRNSFQEKRTSPLAPARINRSIQRSRVPNKHLVVDTSLRLFGDRDSSFGPIRNHHSHLNVYSPYYSPLSPATTRDSQTTVPKSSALSHDKMTKLRKQTADSTTNSSATNSLTKRSILKNPNPTFFQWPEGLDIMEAESRGKMFDVNSNLREELRKAKENADQMIRIVLGDEILLDLSKPGSRNARIDERQRSNTIATPARRVNRRLENVAKMEKPSPKTTSATLTVPVIQLPEIKPAIIDYALSRSKSWPPSRMISTHSAFLAKLQTAARVFLETDFETLHQTNAAKDFMNNFNGLMTEGRQMPVGSIEAEDLLMKLLYIIAPVSRAAESLVKIRPFISIYIIVSSKT